MMKKLISALIIFAVLIGINTAQASITDLTCTFPDDPDQTDHSWTFDTEDQLLNLSESITQPGQDQVNITTQAPTDPPFTISKTVTNSSDVAWTEYQMLLDSEESATFASGATSSSPYLQSVSQPDSYTIIYSGTEAVDPGDTVTFDFDVVVPGGEYSFTLTQNAIPEPATIGLLAVGGLALTRKKK